MIKKNHVQEQDTFPLHDVRVIDGDTIEAHIILPFDQKLKARIRLRGWWADEPIGMWEQAGLQAKTNLQVFCAGKALWLVARGHRLDKYGRILGHLMASGELINPGDVLGGLQLTEAEHKAHRDQNKGYRPPAVNQCAPVAITAPEGSSPSIW